MLQRGKDEVLCLWVIWLFAGVRSREDRIVQFLMVERHLVTERG